MPHDRYRRALTDTGPLLAMIYSNDKNYIAFWDAMGSLSDQGLVTPVSCLVEALYLLEKAGGHKYQQALWKLIDDGVVKIRPESVAECLRARELMSKYADIPMDFADGVVVALAETPNVTTVFTTDKHFYAYRTGTGESFLVIPGRS